MLSSKVTEKIYFSNKQNLENNKYQIVHLVLWLALHLNVGKIVLIYSDYISFILGYNIKKIIRKKNNKLCSLKDPTNFNNNLICFYFYVNKTKKKQIYLESLG